MGWRLIEPNYSNTDVSPLTEIYSYNQNTKKVCENVRSSYTKTRVNKFMLNAAYIILA